MASIRLQKTIKAPAKVVFSALTQQAHLEKWFAPEVITIPKQDTYAAFAFGFDLNFKVYILKLVSGKFIEWEFVSGNVEWDNSVISFRLAGNIDKTKVLFTHKGLDGGNGKFEKWRKSWSNYLSKLKEYAESGSAGNIPQQTT
jgi:uncharacterized protein YndB with AHSA1/START domain